MRCQPDNPWPLKLDCQTAAFALYVAQGFSPARPFFAALKRCATNSRRWLPLCTAQRQETADMSRTAADVLADPLIDWGVRVVFGMPGDGINGIMESRRARFTS
jgi:hypothetical protein